MIRNKHLMEMKEILLCFNNDENLAIDDFGSVIESPRLFFELLLSFDKKKVRRLISVKKEDRKKEKNNKIDFSQEDVFSIISVNTREELEKKYSLSELKTMYEKIYSRKPLSDATKTKIAVSLKKIMLQQQRVADFSNI